MCPTVDAGRLPGQPLSLVGRGGRGREGAHVVEVAEVAPGIHRLALPLGIHGVETLSAYLLPDPAGDTLVDCGIAVGPEDEDACAALDEGLRACGSSVEGVARLVVTHAHVDHFGLAG